MPVHCPDSMSAVADLFMAMTPEKLERLGDVYGPGIAFYDPIHEARGLQQLREVLSKWFKKMPEISFKILDAHGDDRTGFLQWVMNYQRRGNEQVIHGMSHFRFAPDGRICEQRDQWDASFVLYGEHPVVRWMMEQIKRRAQLFGPDSDGTSLAATVKQASR